MNKRWPALLVLLLAACNFPTGGPVSTISPTQPATSAPAPTDDPAAPAATEAALPPQQRAIYTLDATLDYGAHYLAVVENIIYANNSRDPLSEIPLLVAADNLGALFAVDDIELDRSGTWAYETGRHILVTLDAPLAPGEQITLTLTYSLALPQRASTLGWTERQSTFIDWYPYIPPYVEGEGWLINEPTTQGEYLTYDSADFHVNIYAQNTPALFQIAAPSPAVLSGGAHNYTLQNARRFSWTASGHFKTSTQTAGTANFAVTIYFYEEERDAAEAALQTAVQAITVYEDLYGQYPYASLTIIECTFPDGMESDGLFYLDMEYFRKYSYDARNLLTTLIAHETAHNWWYGAVGNDPATEPWLDEALATYSELLFYERIHPDDVDWWWEFRVNQWQPAGWVNSTAYELPTFRPYVNAVYLRGVQFLHDLRSTIGDDVFLAFMKDYYAQGANKLMTRADFFALLTTHTDQDLNSLTSEYFR